MKKKVIAIVCAVAVLAAAGGGVTWHFLGNSTKEDDNVVYVNTVKALTNLGTGNGMENRYAGVVGKYLEGREKQREKGKGSLCGSRSGGSGRNTAVLLRYREIPE